MKILAAPQIKEVDKRTVEKQGISSLDLMERAGSECVKWILEKQPQKTEFIIFCGTGNNGGDGLVIARKLKEMHYRVQVIEIPLSSESSDYISNKERAIAAAIQVHRWPEKPVITNSPRTMVIDCVLGTGVSRKPEGEVARAIAEINKLKVTVCSIDIPSGLFSEDNSANDLSMVVHADITLSLHAPKLSLLLPDTGSLAGELQVIPIGLDQDIWQSMDSQLYLFTHQDAGFLYRPRGKFAHKGTFGHALLVGGSSGKAGAVAMASHAAVRSGAGLVSAAVPAYAGPILQSSLPEVMVEVCGNEKVEGKLPLNYSAIGIGPGLGKDPATAQSLKVLLQELKAPLVLDADALNILSENKTWLSFLPPSCILTPHVVEFERLTHKHRDAHERLITLKNVSVKWNSIIVLKGAHTQIAFPDGTVFFNSTGNPGMATGGSGDVLTGIITSLLAQGYKAPQAALLGVYLHGLAGDFAAEKFSEEAMSATDIIAELSQAYKLLRKINE